MSSAPNPVADPELCSVEGGDVLVWRLPGPMLAVASSPLGGGMGLRSWVINVQVPHSYGRFDIEDHLQEVAAELGLKGAGVGFLTAATVRRWTSDTDDAVRVDSTVGIGVPTWAAADDEEAPLVGTINVVARLPRRLSDAALVNAVVTVTEAKTQALLHEEVPGTGTASDAVCILCPSEGRPDPFGGPRSALGAPLARATHRAVLDGTRGFRQEWPERPDHLAPVIAREPAGPVSPTG